jgi:hypothetical protein
MRIKVERGGRIFEVRKPRTETSKIAIRKVDDVTYEIEVRKLIRVVSVRLPYQLYEIADQYAKKNKTTISQIIREALVEYLLMKTKGEGKNDKGLSMS